MATYPVIHDSMYTVYSTLGIAKHGLVGRGGVAVLRHSDDEVCLFSRNNLATTQESKNRVIVVVVVRGYLQQSCLHSFFV